MIGPIAASPQPASALTGMPPGTDPWLTIAPLAVAGLALLAALFLLGRDRRGEAPAKRTHERYQVHRDELLATLGHELRSPLRALIALLDGAVERDDAERREELRTLAGHALRVAEDSLDFALLERGAVRLRSDPVDLEAVIADVLSVVRPLRRDGVALELDLAPDLPLRRLGDGARIAQVLVNLLTNAFAHTPHGDVRLSVVPAAAASGSGPAVAFVVRDSGTGMTPAERRRAFIPFEQGEAPRGRAGIGLAVVARIVDAMGGTVTLDTAAGLGSTFTVTTPMPVDPDALGQAPALAEGLVGVCCARATDGRSLLRQLTSWNITPLTFPDPEALRQHLQSGSQLDALILVQDALPDALEGLLGARMREGLVVARSTPDRPEARLPSALRRALDGTADPEDSDLAGLTVLVVDDHPVARRVLHALLTDRGCRVTRAEDGESALEIARDPEERFDWVLLDRRMPGLDGLATAALLREAPGTRNARIALLVNEAGDDPGAAELFDQVLVRPRHPEALGRLLSLSLGRAADRVAAPTIDPGLAAVRDDTLREDLAALRAATRRGDHAAVHDHLHRMEGALRLCPDPELGEALAALIAAGDEDTTEAAAGTLARHLHAPGD